MPLASSNTLTKKSTGRNVPGSWPWFARRANIPRTLVGSLNLVRDVRAEEAYRDLNNKWQGEINHQSPIKLFPEYAKQHTFIQFEIKASGGTTYCTCRDSKEVCCCLEVF